MTPTHEHTRVGRPARTYIISVRTLHAVLRTCQRWLDEGKKLLEMTKLHMQKKSKKIWRFIYKDLQTFLKQDQFQMYQRRFEIVLTFFWPIHPLNSGEVLIFRKSISHLFFFLLFKLMHTTRQCICHFKQSFPWI